MRGTSLRPNPEHRRLGGRGHAWITPEWKLIHFGADGRSFLFDRRNDPNGLRDLSEAEPATRATLQSALLEHLRAEGHPDAGDRLPNQERSFTEADSHNLLGWMGFGGVG